MRRSAPSIGRLHGALFRKRVSLGISALGPFAHSLSSPLQIVNAVNRGQCLRSISINSVLSSIYNDIDLLGSTGNDTRTVVDAYGGIGFRVNGLDTLGAVLCFTRSFFLFDIARPEELCPDAFALVPLLKPKPEFLLIGTGRKMVMIDPNIKKELRKHGITVDVMDTANAAHTFNVLNGEGRQVAAALLTIDHYERPGRIRS